jgi:hypothetical protein
MRIRTSGDYAWRTDLCDGVGEQLGEPTRSGAIDDTGGSLAGGGIVADGSPTRVG